MSLERGEFNRTSAAFPRDFFDALNSGDKELAMHHFRTNAKTPEGMLTPKAAEYNKQGEWDSLTGLQLMYVGAGHCGGRPGQDGTRSCAKGPGDCPAKAHADAPRMPPGWYIAAGGRAAGCYTSPMLPPASNGGPIAARGAGLLADRENPFRLTKAQWQFIIDAWNRSQGLQVETQELGADPIPNAEDSPAADFERVEEVERGEEAPRRATTPAELELDPQLQEVLAAVVELRARMERCLEQAEGGFQRALEDLSAAQNESHRYRQAAVEFEERVSLAQRATMELQEELDRLRRQNQALAQRILALETGAARPRAVDRAVAPELESAVRRPCSGL
jgi:hypothetical protein